jgi:bla regulator protein BlaR1
MNWSQWQPLANHLWQSTAFAALAALLTLALRNNRAQVRYGLWLAASVKFLAPFSILVDVGSLFGRHTEIQVPQSGLPFVIEQASQPFAAPPPLLTMAAVGQHSSSNWMPALLYAVWAIGFASLALSWWRRWRVLRSALRTASPLDLPIGLQAMTSPAFAEPGVFGVRRPILLLPAGIMERLTPQQLKAILAHELCHVRRRDNLATAIHMAVEAIFWFHPLVWWLGARLMEERERACDEEVLRQGSEPEVYAGGILKICELYLESPLPCVAGVTGANLRKRIEAIMSNRVVTRLSNAKKFALVTAGAAALAAPILVGVLTAPAILAQSTQGADQSTKGAAAQFEVASVKPCVIEDDAGRGNGKSGGSGRIRWTPGRLEISCATLDNLIRDAYLSYPDGKPWAAATRAEPTPDMFGVAGSGCFGCGRGVSPVSQRVFHQQIHGSPAWAGSDRYQIDGKAEGQTNPEMMRGPMMRTLLEERFKLKVHRESKEVPVYELTVADGGARLQPAQEQNCLTGPPATQRAPGQDPPRICGRGGVEKSGTAYFGTTIAQFCSVISGWFDRDVIDKTGIPGVFDLHLDAHRVDLPDLSAGDPAAGTPPRRAETDYAATLKAFQAALLKLGLKLEPAKGPGVFLVIDHVERPSGN